MQHAEPVTHDSDMTGSAWCSTLGAVMDGRPAEHSRGTPSKWSPTLAAWAATTLAAWICKVLDTASADRLPLPEVYCSLVAA